MVEPSVTLLRATYSEIQTWAHLKASTWPKHNQQVSMDRQRGFEVQGTHLHLHLATGVHTDE